MSDTQIIAISSELPPDLYKAFNAIGGNDTGPDSIMFLSDVDHRVIDRYGILNQESKGLPHPATYVIDKKGIVRWRFVEVDYRERPTNQQILDAIKSLR
jgi:peroxiredoxin